MKSEPLVSFIVVTHDRPPALVRARIIQSVLVQTHRRKELVLVGEACANLDEIAVGLDQQPELERVVVSNLERPAEELCVWALVARARNAGIRLAHGEYLCCQDDDNELVPQFASEMLRVIRERQVLAAWCWRKILTPDGRPFGGDYFPWMAGDEGRRRILYRIWREAGIIVPGSPVVRDSLYASRRGERFSSTDPNEWLAHRDVYRLVPFRECYRHNEIVYHVTFDDIWDEEFARSGLPVACWEYPGLIYYLGGTSNTPPEKTGGY